MRTKLSSSGDSGQILLNNSLTLHQAEIHEPNQIGKEMMGDCPTNLLTDFHVMQGFLFWGEGVGKRDKEGDFH